MFCDEGAFLKVQEGRMLRIGIIDAKAEEAGQVQRKEKREICQHSAFTRIQVGECIFYEIKQVRIGLWLLETFLQ